MHAWRARNGAEITLDHCPLCMERADEAIKGFQDEYPQQSWWWVNAERQSYLDGYILEHFADIPVGQISPDSRDPGRDKFIILQKGTNQGGPGGSKHFVVMTREQDTWCSNYPGALTCAGHSKALIGDISQ